MADEYTPTGEYEDRCASHFHSTPRQPRCDRTSGFVGKGTQPDFLVTQLAIYG
jgi:hypothetical protein